MTRATFSAPAACDVALWIIQHRAGLTEAELSEAMFGRRDQPRVHQNLDVLEGKGLIERRRNLRPMTLHPINSK